MKKISKFAVFMTVVMFAPIFGQIMPANAATLYAPSLTAPASDQVLTNFPRTATFNWSAVSGATRYELEIACDVCVSKTNKWANAKSYSVTGTTYTTKVPGADNQFRWRVRGYNGSTAGSWSVYRYFRYNTKPGSSNPVTTAPTITAPTQNQVFSSKDVSLDWTDVTGNKLYFYEVEKLLEYNGTWSTSVIAGSSYASSATLSIPGYGKYRVHVQSISTNDVFGKFSDYRYFEYRAGSSTTAPVITAPTANQVFTDINSTVTGRWNAVSGAQKYQLELYKDSNLVWNGETSNTYYSVNLKSVSYFTSVNGNYHGRVRAVFSGSTYSNWSDYRYFSISINSSTTGKPVISEPYEGQNIGDSITHFDWSDVTNAVQYNYVLERWNGTSWATLFNANTTQSWEEVYINSSNTYGQFRFQVRAIFAGSVYGEWSDWRNYTNNNGGSNTLTAPVIIVPTAGQDVNSNTMTASWYAVSGAVSYEINTNYESYGNWYEEGTYTGITALSKTIGPLPVNEYRMKIRAKFSNGSYTNWSDWRYFDITNGSNSSVGTPTLSSPVDEAHVTSNYVSLDWSTVSGATSYEYEVTRYIDGGDWTGVTNGSVTASEKSVTLTSGLYGQYSFRVRAVKNGSYGNWTGYNHFYYDNGSSNYTKPVIQTPSQNSTVENNTRQINLSWSGVSGAYEYQVQIGPEGSSATYYTTANTTYTYTAPTDNTWYKLYVRAHLSGGSYTNWSDQRLFYYHYTGSNGSDYTAPIITSPSAGQTVFSNLVYSIWSPVTTAVSYEVNVNYKTGNSWMEEGTYTVTSADKTLYLNYTNDYRMRVRAKFSDSTYTDWSGWREFKVQL